MTNVLMLEDFDSSRIASPTVSQSFGDEALEDMRMAGYEAGYKTGWDDAINSQSEGQVAIREEFARNLRDLGFTYFEARAHVQSAATTLVRQIVEELFPRLSSHALQHHVQDVINTLVDSAIDAPFTLRTSETEADTMRELLSDSSVPIDVVPEPTLSQGQVLLKIGADETEIDVRRLSAVLENALDALETETKRAVGHE